MAVTSKVVTPASASEVIASSDGALRAAGQPAVTDGHPLADVDGDRDPVRPVATDQPATSAGSASAAGADDDPRGARVEGGRDGFGGAKATGDLDTDDRRRRPR